MANSEQAGGDLVNRGAVVVDVAVVGAGPAGCAAAITAHRSGLKVILLDKASFPRDKACGDGLTALALKELAGLGVSFRGQQEERQLSTFATPEVAVLRSPAGRVVRLPLRSSREGSPGVAAASISKRLELDFALIETARNQGIEVLEGAGLERLELADSMPSTVSVRGSTANVPPANAHPASAQLTVLELSNGTTLKARYVVAADGVYSRARKLLGAGPANYLGEWHAARQYRQFNGHSESNDAEMPAAASQLWVWFEPDLLPGYVWSFPLADGVVNFGFCALRSNEKRNTRHRNAKSAAKSAGLGSRMAETWRSLLARPHIAEVLGESQLAGPQRAWPIPARQIGDMPLSHGPVLFCGDAAAVADPLTGEGIGQALISGRLAAEAVAKASAETASAANTAGNYYERAIKQTLGADLQLSGWLSKILSKPACANFAVRSADLNGWTRRQFGRWMFEDYPRAMVFTPRRWRKRA